jgi:hypothetical protein
VAAECVVYEAEDLKLSRHVPLKFLPDEFAPPRTSSKPLPARGQGVFAEPSEHLHGCFGDSAVGKITLTDR